MKAKANDNASVKEPKRKRSGKVHQIIFDSLFAIFMPGTSKREAREAETAKKRKEALKKGATPEEAAKMRSCKSPFIHGDRTFELYLAICNRFWTWVQEHYPDVQTLRYALKIGCARAYIQNSIDIGKKPSTIATETSALAKLFRCHANDIHDNRPERRTEDFTRSRGYNEERYEQDREEYGVMAEICRMTGLRREELGNVKKRNFRKDDSGRWWVHLDGRAENTKGGRDRDIYILDRHQVRLREILESVKSDDDDVMFPVVPNGWDIHGIRSLYAMDYYNAIARDIDSIPKNERVPLPRPKKDNSRPNKIRTDAPAVYRRRWDGKKFDRVAALEVSKSLGHSRVDVVILNYLR